MDLLPAYRALIASPEQSAHCGQATTIGQLLQRLRDLWQLESVADGPLIAELGRCNRQDTGLGPRHLAGHWFPCDYHAASRTVSWCLPQGHATEPFQDQYIDRCRQRSVFNQLIRPRTPIATLMSDRQPAASDAAASPVAETASTAPIAAPVPPGEAERDAQPPVLPAEVKRAYVAVSRATPRDAALTYLPALLARGRLHYVDAKSRSGLDAWINVARLARVEEPVPRDPWDDAAAIEIEGLGTLSNPVR